MGLITIAKLGLYGMFLNYYCYYIIRGSFISYGTIMLFGMATISVLISAIRDRYVHIGYEVRLWLLYASLAVVTMSWAVNSDVVIRSVPKYVQRTLLIMMIAYICEKENSVRFALQLMAVTSIACAVSILYTVDNIEAKLSISTGANLSANDVGCIMAFGVFCVIFAFGNGQRANYLLSIAKIAAIIAEISVIFLAGSRKSIYAIIILVVLLIVLCQKDYFKANSVTTILVYAFLIAIAIMYVNNNLSQYVEGTNLYVRMFGRGVERAASSDESRIDLYIMAMKEFFTHPIVGLGFNCFDYVHGNYTHSIYVESLACNGIIGLLYLAPYWMMLKKQYRLIKLNRDNTKESLWQKELLAFYISFLFIGVGIPYMYKDVPCIVLGMMIASQYISYKKVYKQ